MGPSWPRDRTHVSWIYCIGERVLYHWATGYKFTQLNCSLRLSPPTLLLFPDPFPRSCRCRPASWFENSPCLLLFLPHHLSQEFSPNKPLACLIPSWSLLLRGPEVTHLPFLITCHIVLLSSPAFARVVPSIWRIFSFLLDSFLANSYAPFRIELWDALIHQRHLRMVHCGPGIVPHTGDIVRKERAGQVSALIKLTL